MGKYVPFTLEKLKERITHEFENHFKVETELAGSEYVLNVGKNGKVVKIYTSIGPSGMTRSKGSDAVRVFLYDEINKEPLSRSRRIYRTKGAISRIIKTTKVLLKEVEDRIQPEKDSEEPPVVKVAVDEDEWIPTEKFRYCRFEYESFNPVQSAFYRIHDRMPANFVVAATTSAGKTVIAEMAIAYTIEVLRRPALYLAPLKALTQEKIDDWSDPSHSFSKYRKTIATGDYITPENRRKVLADCARSDLVIMTTEMLDSLTRKMDRHAEVLKRVGLLVVDEAHLLTVQKRGSALECALLRMTEHFSTPVLFLSATMPNTEELAEWLAELNGYRTYVISSDWRPCSLDIHYIGYEDYGGYHVKTENLISEIVDLIFSYPNDKFLVFVHSKSFGRKLLGRLESLGLKSEFHNADLEKEDRLRLVEEFKRKDGLRVLIATSTLAWGINVPARRVIIAGVHRGHEEVSPIDIRQMVGRAGRVGLDPKGDAYILIPVSKWRIYDGYADLIPPVTSRLLNQREMAFHIISKVAEGINTLDRLGKWYERTLAARQELPGVIQQTPDVLLTGTISYLRDCEAISVESDWRLKPTHIGLIANYLYYEPEFIYRLRNNLLEINSMSTIRDADLAWALGSAFEPLFCSSDVQSEVEDYLKTAGVDLDIRYGTEVYVAVIHMLMSGMEVPPVLGSVARNIRYDSERLAAAAEMISQRFGFRNVMPHVTVLGLRLKYGVSKEMVELVRIEGVGSARAKKMFATGIKTPKDIVLSPEKVRKLFQPKVAEKIIQNAAKIASHVNGVV